MPNYSSPHDLPWWSDPDYDITGQLIKHGEEDEYPQDNEDEELEKEEDYDNDNYI